MKEMNCDSTYLSTHSIIQSFMYSFIHLSSYSFIYSSVSSFIYSSVYSFIYSFIHSFIHSYNLSFLPSLRILTPSLNYNGEICVRFAYSMFGNHIGSLRMYTQLSDSNRITRWNLQGDQGQDWILAAVDVGEVSSQMRVSVMLYMTT
jgi:hypothetical protein